MSDPDWSALPPLRDVIARHDLRADRALGQNFLLDANVTDRIVRGAGNVAGATVFEIGPGPGGLTRSLLRAGARRVVAVEYDPRAVRALGELEECAAGRLRVVHADALDVSLQALAADEAAKEHRRMIVANLPYNIATPLLIGWLKEIHADPAAYDSLTVMVQREVAERLSAAPGGKTYGRLSVIAQWLCAVRPLFTLPPQAFTPPPKVRSTVVHFTPLPPATDAPSFAAVEAVTAAAFGQRRKMVRSSLKAYAPFLASCSIPEDSRAETLPVDRYVALARATGPIP